MGAFGAMAGLSFLIGPFVGGWITDNVNWHWIFFVNVPLALVTVLAVARLLPNRRLEAAHARDLDHLGIACFAAGLVPLLIGLTDKSEIDPATGQQYLWSDGNVLGPIAASVVLLLLYLAIESRAAHPIVPLDLFKNRVYALSMLVTFIVGFGAFMAIIFMPRFYQTVRGISATASGYYVWPIFLGMMAGSIGSGMIISRTGRYKWLISGSTLVLALGSYLMTRLTAGTADWLIWAWLLPVGLGIGPSIAGFTVVVQSLVPAHRIGAASGSLTLFRQVGSVMGLAVAGTVFSSVYEGRLPESLMVHGLPLALATRLTRLSTNLQGVGNGQGLLHRILTGPDQHFIPQIVAGANDAFTQAVAESFIVTVAVGLVAFVLSLVLHNSELHSQGYSAPDSKE